MRVKALLKLDEKFENIEKLKMEMKKTSILKKQKFFFSNKTEYIYVLDQYSVSQCFDSNKIANINFLVIFN